MNIFMKKIDIVVILNKGREREEDYLKFFNVLGKENSRILFFYPMRRSGLEYQSRNENKYKYLIKKGLIKNISFEEFKSKPEKRLSEKTNLENLIILVDEWSYDGDVLYATQEDFIDMGYKRENIFVSCPPHSEGDFFYQGYPHNQFNINDLKQMIKN